MIDSIESNWDSPVRQSEFVMQLGRQIPASYETVSERGNAQNILHTFIIIISSFRQFVRPIIGLDDWFHLGEIGTSFRIRTDSLLLS